MSDEFLDFYKVLRLTPTEELWEAYCEAELFT